MAHEHDIRTTDTTTAVAELTAPPDAPEPEYIARARRILAGDVRPDDYLPTTPEVEAGVALDMTSFNEAVRRDFEAGRIPAVFEFDPCVEVRQRTMRLLSAYHARELVVSTSDDRGTVVLAVGVEDCAALMHALPYNVTKDLDYRAVEPPEGFWP